MKISRFEELDAWKEARKLYKMIIDVTNNSKINKDFAFVNQLRGAALSVMSNIAEGFETLTSKEGINFLNFARRSCGEVRSHLYAGFDASYFGKETFDNLYLQTTKTGKIISGFISYLKSRNV